MGMPNSQRNLPHRLPRPRRATLQPTRNRVLPHPLFLPLPRPHAAPRRPLPRRVGLLPLLLLLILLLPATPPPRTEHGRGRTRRGKIRRFIFIRKGAGYNPVFILESFRVAAKTRFYLLFVE